MPKPPSPQSVRLTIAVTPEVHAVFTRMANASGLSLSKCMGEWLGDTSEAAEFMATRLEQARAAPRQVIQELQALTAGMGDELTQLLADVRSGKKALPPSKDARSAPAGGGSPRSVIRGGKSRTDRAKARGNEGGEDQ